MKLYCLLLLLLLPSISESFVYSCEEVLLQLMNSSIEQYATYAHVVTQHDFTNWTQLEHLYLVNGDSQYSFAEFADKGRQTGEGPWTVVGYDAPAKYLECQEEFTLILKSDELPVVQFNSISDDDITRYSSGSSVFVNPLNGMWITKNVMSGEGNVTVYTGAGIGEEEERLMLQSWPYVQHAEERKEREFRAEIDLMQRIGFHEKLVNMLACVTISDPILLICEYCANGDLLDFLRKKRKFMLENTDETDVGKVITVEKQLIFAIQIAYGMEYLSSRGFVHRDIAARNIMLDSQESCKIGDFGLARELGDNSENYQAQGRKLPLKCLLKQLQIIHFQPHLMCKGDFCHISCEQCTSQFRWSFGVLLYEIVTLGATPYAGWIVAELLTRMKQGERMERPDNCSDNLYEFMRVCWSEHPFDRPTFTELRKHLGELLEEVNEDDYYLKLNANANYYVLESNVSD